MSANTPVTVDYTPLCGIEQTRHSIVIILITQFLIGGEFMNNFRFLSVVLMIMFLLVACEQTYEGAGEDVERIGENIQDSAE